MNYKKKIKKLGITIFRLTVSIGYYYNLYNFTDLAEIDSNFQLPVQGKSKQLSAALWDKISLAFLESTLKYTEKKYSFKN